MAALNEMGVNIVENEEQGEDGEGEEEADDAADSVDGDSDSGPQPEAKKKETVDRTDDPVRMYLREMGAVELLSREGEIAIAKRIEAGRDTMILGLCESPITFNAIIDWSTALNEGTMQLREILDLDAMLSKDAGPENLGEDEDDDNGEISAKNAGPQFKEEEEPEEPSVDDEDGEGGERRGPRAEDEEEDNALSLAQLEETLKPQALETPGSSRRATARKQPLPTYNPVLLSKPPGEPTHLVHFPRQPHLRTVVQLAHQAHLRPVINLLHQANRWVLLRRADRTKGRGVHTSQQHCTTRNGFACELRKRDVPGNPQTRAGFRLPVDLRIAPGASLIQIPLASLFPLGLKATDRCLIRCVQHPLGCRGRFQRQCRDHHVRHLGKDRFIVQPRSFWSAASALCCIVHLPVLSCADRNISKQNSSFNDDKS